MVASSWPAVGTVVLGRLGPGLAFFFILGARIAMTKTSTTEITAMAIAATVLSIICGGGGGGGGGADHGNRMSLRELKRRVDNDTGTKVNLRYYSSLLTVKTLTGMTTDVYSRENCMAPAIVLIVWTT